MKQEAPSLSPSGEACWQSLRHHLQWVEGFWIGYVFTDHPPSLFELQKRSEQLFWARSQKQQVIRLESPGQADEVLHQLFEQSDEHIGCTWVQLTHKDFDGQEEKDGSWARAWDKIQLRTNERRELLGKMRPGGVIFASTSDKKARSRAAAPDLWSFRSLLLEPEPPLGRHAVEPAIRKSKQLDSGLARVPDLELSIQALNQAQADQNPRAEAEAFFRAAQGFFDNEEYEKTLEFVGRFLQLTDDAWRQAQAEALRAQAEVELGDWVGAEQHFKRALDLAGERRNLDVCDWLVDFGDLLESRSRLGEAESVFRRNLEFVEKLIQGDKSVELLRQKSVALERLGRVYFFEKKLTNARATLDQDLMLARELVVRTGESTSSLRDLSVSLNHVGNLRLFVGDLPGAESAYLESLQLARRLVLELGGQPESLRDLSVTLDNVGDIRYSLDDLSGADSAYMESLDLRRRLVLKLGEQPESLRDLSVSLNNVGDVRYSLDDLPGAESAYLESLELTRRLLSVSGDQPEFLRDLSVCLDNVGNVRYSLDDFSGAESVYLESLQLARRLLSLLGDQPESLRDLSVSLNNVGNVRYSLDDLSGAESAYTESLGLRRSLVLELGDQPESLRDLAMSLNNVGDVRYSLDDLSGAESVYLESLKLARRLLSTLGDQPESLYDMAQSVWNVSEIQEANGRLRDAHQSMQECVETYKKLCLMAPQVKSYKDELDSAHAELERLAGAVQNKST